MIFYFTGTGNSLEAALMLAEETGDALVDIGKAYKRKQFDFVLTQGEDLGFVFPTYQWSTPAIIDSFIKHARFRDESGAGFSPGYCYLVLTCGAFVGETARFFETELRREQGMRLDASFSVRTVGNCVSLYAPAEGQRRDSVLAEARRQAKAVAESVAHKEKGRHERRNLFGMLMSAFTGREEKPRSTREFYALSTCTSCGQCAEICPTNTITIIGGTPRWAELGCTQCYACIHRCPPHAIQYGKKTETRSRYINPILHDQA